MNWVNVLLSNYSYELYLGNASTAIDPIFLRSKKIKFIISVDASNEEERFRFANTFGICLYNRYFYDDISPLYEPKVRSISSEVSHILHNCLQKGNTYIHCQAGINRSSLCVANFLIQYENKTPQQAIDYLKMLNKMYRGLPCLYNELFVKILGGENDQIKKFRMFYN